MERRYLPVQFTVRTRKGSKAGKLLLHEEWVVTMYTLLTNITDEMSSREGGAKHAAREEAACVFSFPY